MGNIPPSVLRQPPPPPSGLHRGGGALMADVSTLMTDKEEGNTEMVGGNCASVNSRTRAYYFRRCKMKSLTSMESLPDDLVFKILLHLPAQDIYDPARLVCRKWYHMIHTHNFIHAQLQHATCGLIFQYRAEPEGSVFIAMRQGRIEISKFNYKFRCPVWASCNGLVLEYEFGNFYALYIANPATKQHFVLPRFSHEAIYAELSSGIAYAAASMEYKVVVAYAPDIKSETQKQRVILTVRVDNSWRNVCIKHLSLKAKEAFDARPLMTEGFVHWAYGTRVLTFNVETELITETPAPIPQVSQGKKWKYYLSTGRYLSLLIAFGKFLWEVWEMKPPTGEWTKLPNIDMEDQKCAFNQFSCRRGRILLPVGWLEYPEVVVFGVHNRPRNCVFYNLHTHEIYCVNDLPTSTNNIIFVDHRNSLEWLGGS